MLCKYCEALRLWIRRGPNAAEGESFSAPVRALGAPAHPWITLDHQSSIQRLEESSRHGCELCHLFWSHPEAREPPQVNGPVGAPLQVSYSPKLVNTHGVSSFPWNGPILVPALILFIEGKLARYVGFESYIPRDSTLCADAKILGRPVDPDVCSTATSSLIKEWLRTCSENHDDCHAHTPSTLPARIIDVGTQSGEEAPRLLLKSTAQAPYVALSYHRAEKHSIVQEPAGSAVLTNLPRLFRDAIRLIQKLDMRYLWIDTLCGTSGSTRPQAQDTADAYSNAYLTIISTGTNGVDEDLLNQRTADIPSFTTLVENPHTQVGGQLSFRRAIPFNGPAEARENIYDQHAWRLQETLLSPRVLRITSTQLNFHCSKHYRESSTGPLYQSFHNSWIALSFAHNATPRNLSKRWCELVEMYSHRQHDREEDALPAIAAFARNHARLSRGDQYVAGLWAAGLHHQLLWTRDETVDGQHTHSLAMPDSYRAPSFSWASVKGPVRIYFNKFELRWPWYQHEPDDYDESYAFRVEILHAETELKDGSVPFGEILSGHLVIKGYTRDLFYHGHSAAGHSNGRPYSNWASHPRRFGQRYLLNLDFPSDDFLGTTVECVQIARTGVPDIEPQRLEENEEGQSALSGFEEGIVHVLIVKPAVGGNYRRIGAGWVYQRWAEEPGWELKTLTLV